ncbi:MAG: hypothetical protein BWY73_00566 [candidate division TA06 bacterium ADurb.Bin417]|uniref:Uncharacterized protein n=1 Tax=candidate division TA06 bacterium ADurb.Bin417 TaxID=1852828 RepID=A0A1V5MI87_UNCT6|nr:MAG: hypothetical protein BWY73_00566 [candidate division TA06 bacterium ADurb.Bin417]
MPTWQEIGLSWVAWRPSIRTRLVRIWRRTRVRSSLSKTPWTSLGATSGPTAARTSCRIPSKKAARSTFWAYLVTSPKRLSRIEITVSSQGCFSGSGSADFSGMNSSLKNWTIFRASCSPKPTASRTRSSGRLRADPSSISSDSVPAITTRESSLFWRSVTEGLTTSCPSTRPTRTPATTSLALMGPRVTAAEAPRTASMSGSTSGSKEKTKEQTWISRFRVLGKSGRMVRSMSRQVSTSFSVGRPSRLKNPPGNLPAAEMCSRYSTVRGRKSCRFSSSLPKTRVVRTMVSPERTITEAVACWANVSVSKLIVFPPISISFFISIPLLELLPPDKQPIGPFWAGETPVKNYL